MTDAEEAEHVAVIRSCVREILDESANRGLTSIAFPLLGTGLFGLDEKLLAFEFFRTVSEFAREHDSTGEFQVVLCTLDDGLLPQLVESGTQAWASRLPARPAWPSLMLGAEYLDDFFANEVAKEAHPQWSAWLWCRFAELLTGYVCAILCTEGPSTVWPKDFADMDRPISFGVLRDQAVKRAKYLKEADPSLSRFAIFARDRVLDADGARHLERLNRARNDLAHGRSALPASQLRTSLVEFVDPEGWSNACSDEIGADTPKLEPYITRRDDGTVGVLERWHANKLRYVVPRSGEIFFNAEMNAGGAAS